MYRYGKSSNMAALRTGSALSDDQIARFAPSIFAEDKAPDRSQRYAFINTRTVLDGLRHEGFQPVEVRQTRTRKQGKEYFTKHMIRFQHPDLSARADGDHPEIALLNSHDGTSSYQLLSGWFRFICSNGLICGQVQNDIRIKHSGNVVDNVIEGAFRVVDELQEVDGQIGEMKSIPVNRQERLLLANAAADLRWGDERHPVEAESLVVPRRFEDCKDDLWTAFNTVQENIVKGGIAGRTANGRNTHTRAVTGVNEDVRLNRGLWKLAEVFSGLKNGTIDADELQAQLA